MQKLDTHCCTNTSTSVKVSKLEKIIIFGTLHEIIHVYEDVFVMEDTSDIEDKSCSRMALLHYMCKIFLVYVSLDLFEPREPSKTATILLNLLSLAQVEAL